jgi:putative membrane protein insertion efficiency factor
MNTELHWIWKYLNAIPIAFIRLYQLTLSPYLGGACRFHPTCSNYGLEAFKTHNFFTALGLTLWRILRCNPFVKGGYDPVPQRNSNTSSKNG